MRDMRMPHDSIPIHFSLRHHARTWFVLAVTFFLLAAGSLYWREIVQYHTYLAIGLVLFLLGLIPVIARVFQRSSKT
jgi:cbb3-type cytochrome oxidase subunit 3